MKNCILSNCTQTNIKRKSKKIQISITRDGFHVGNHFEIFVFPRSSETDLNLYLCYEHQGSIFIRNTERWKIKDKRQFQCENPRCEKTLGQIYLTLTIIN